MDNQHIFDRANECENLLNNAAFTQLFKELMDHYTNGILASQPEQEKQRESLYYQTRALQDILGVMQQWIVMRDQLLETKESE